MLVGRKKVSERKLTECADLWFHQGTGNADNMAEMLIFVIVTCILPGLNSKPKQVIQAHSQPIVIRYLDWVHIGQQKQHQNFGRIPPFTSSIVFSTPQKFCEDLGLGCRREYR